MENGYTDFVNVADELNRLFTRRPECLSDAERGAIETAESLLRSARSLLRSAGIYIKDAAGRGENTGSMAEVLQSALEDTEEEANHWMNAYFRENVNLSRALNKNFPDLKDAQKHKIASLLGEMLTKVVPVITNDFIERNFPGSKVRLHAKAAVQYIPKGEKEPEA